MNATRCTLDDTHILRMTDDTGMFQHAQYSVPDPSFGYTTDDNARALIMAAMLYNTYRERKYLDLVYRYLQFLYYAWDGKWFRNFMGYDRRFIEERGSDDCFGRCLWSLAFIMDSEILPQGVRESAEKLFNEAVKAVGDLYYNRGKAYTLLGLCPRKNLFAEKLIRQLGASLAEALNRHAEDGWFWFEEQVTYCNAILPLGLLEASAAVHEKKWLELGQKSLDFLLEKTFAGDIFRPVGCKGWLVKGGEPAMYDQQPVEACETLLACLRAYELTGDVLYLKRAHSCFAWYTGKNTAGISLIDPDTGGCMDGITPEGLNKNEGAESLVSWHIARETWNRAKHLWQQV